MKNIFPAILFGLLVLAIVPVMASETVNAGNRNFTYSFTFNMTIPHQIGDTKGATYMAFIKTFDGQISIYGDPIFGLSDDAILIDGTGEKNIAGLGKVPTQIYIEFPVSNSSDFVLVAYDENSKKLFTIHSELNLTQSLDFFKDVKIARIKK